MTVTPLADDKPVFRAASAENVVVNPALKKLLDKAGLSPPPPGHVLSIGHVNDRLRAAQLPLDERMEVKNGLVRMRLVEMGKPISVFN